MSAASSEEQSRRTCQSCSRPSSNLSSTGRPRGCSTLPCRTSCSLPPTRGLNEALRRSDGGFRLNDPQERKIMGTRLTYLVLGLAIVGLCGLAYAQGIGTGVLKLPQDIEFKGPLTGPPQTVVLYGDPTKPGVFVSRVKFSAGWKDPV